jgi:hypothetical protein
VNDDHLDELARLQKYYQAFGDHMRNSGEAAHGERFLKRAAALAWAVALAAEVRAVLAVLADVDADRNICDGETHKLFDRLRAAVGEALPPRAAPG